MNLFKYNTLFPNLIEEWKNTGIIHQALKNNLIEINSVNLRDFGLGSIQAS
jgi:tRNA (guanine-N1)-methyltransferase